MSREYDLALRIDGNNLLSTGLWPVINRKECKRVKFIFSLDSDWKKKSKKAIGFQTGKHEEYVPMLNDTCVLPMELLTGEPILIIAVGEDMGGERIITNSVEVKVK